MVPIISVIILSYNRPTALIKSLKSVVNQNISDLEVIVVDNLSPNSSKIAEVISKFSNVRFLPQTQNHGFTGGMNIGIAAATGAYIHLTEDDIILKQGFYSSLLAEIETHPTALLSGIVYELPGDRCFFCGAELSMGWNLQVKFFKSPPEEALAYQSDLLIGAMMFGHRDTFQKLKGFRDEFFVYFEDVELSWRASKLRIDLMMVPAAQGWHIQPSPYSFLPFIEYHKLKNYFGFCLIYMPAIPLIITIIKYFTYTTIRKAIEGRNLRFLLKVWTRSLIMLPFYISERYKFWKIGFRA